MTPFSSAPTIFQFFGNELSTCFSFSHLNPSPALRSRRLHQPISETGKLILINQPKFTQLVSGSLDAKPAFPTPGQALFCSVPCLPPLSLYQWNFELALPRFHDNCPKVGSPPGSQVGCGLGPNLQGLISPWRKVDSDICAGAPVPPHAQLQLALCAGVCAHQRQPTSGYPPTINGRSAPSFLPGPPQLLGPQGSPQCLWIHRNFQGPAKPAGISTLSTEQRFLFLQKRGSTARVCAHPLWVSVCVRSHLCVC